MAFIAVRQATGETVGVARLARGADRKRAEFAVIVQQDMQGRGLATHLMRRLLDWAPEHGLTEIVGEILAENTPMLDLARGLGFILSHHSDDPQIIEARLQLAPKNGASSSA